MQREIDYQMYFLHKRQLDSGPSHLIFTKEKNGSVQHDMVQQTS